MSEVQPYYAAFLKSGGCDFPAGIQRNTEYVIWIGQRWREWERLTGWSGKGRKTDEERAAFKAWLNNR